MSKVIVWALKTSCKKQKESQIRIRERRDGIKDESERWREIWSSGDM